MELSDQCEDEAMCDDGTTKYPTAGEMRKNPRYVPIQRRKQLMKLALDLADQVERVESHSERQCLLRMLETIINENR